MRLNGPGKVITPPRSFGTKTCPFEDAGLSTNNAHTGDVYTHGNWES